MKYKLIAVAIFLLTLLTINVLAYTEIDGKVVKLFNVGSAGAIVINVDGTTETIPAGATITIKGLEITNLKTYYEDTKLERAAFVRIKSGTETKEVLLGVTPEREEYYMKVGEGQVNCKQPENIDPERKTCRVKLLNVGSGGAIVVSVDGGVEETIPASSTVTIKDLTITNVDSYYVDLKSERAAKIGFTGLKRELAVEETGQVGEPIQPTQEYIDCILKALKSLPIKYSYDRTLTTCSNYKSVGYKYRNCLLDANTIGWGLNDKVREICGLCGDGACGLYEGENKANCPHDCRGVGTPTQLSVKCDGVSDWKGDLSKYPSPYLIDGNPNKLKLVIGDNAPASDTLAAIDIATKLQYDAKSKGNIVNINPVLASEIINPKDYNLILVGRSCDNKLIDEVYPTGDCKAFENSMKKDGFLLVFPNGNNFALIVSGKTPLEVGNAAKVLANYQDYKAEGKMCDIISGETIYVPKKPEVKEPEYGCKVNGICEPEYGENVANCPSDCKEISTPLQCNGCISDGNCLDFGMRIVENSIPKYCDFNKQFIPQKSANAACQNNFECDSNVCAASKCISEGFLKKIMNWFAKMFGYVVKG